MVSLDMAMMWVDVTSRVVLWQPKSAVFNYSQNPPEQSS